MHVSLAQHPSRSAASEHMTAGNSGVPRISGSWVCGRLSACLAPTYRCLPHGTQSRPRPLSTPESLNRVAGRLRTTPGIRPIPTPSSQFVVLRGDCLDSMSASGCLSIPLSSTESALGRPFKCGTSGDLRSPPVSLCPVILRSLQ